MSRVAGLHDRVLRQPSLRALLMPKWRAARRRATAESSLARLLTMGFVGIIFFAIVFAMVYRILGHFRGAEGGIGDLLAAKLLGMILLAFLSILLLSNIITALSSFFLARDLEMLAAAPVDGMRIYAARFIETAINSSWMMVIVLLPILLAFGMSYGLNAGFVAVTIVTLLCFLILPAVVGTAITQLLVNVFPARRARDLLALIALLGAAALIVMFRLLRPEQLARPEGFRNLVDFIASLRTPQSVWLPSEWAAETILTPLGAAAGAGDYFPLLLLVSTAAAFFVMGAWLHSRLYRTGLSRSAEGAAQQQDRGSRRGLEQVLGAVPVTPRSLAVKDIRVFFRDTTQWSQLILLAVLVAVYVYNVKVLPLFSGEEVGFFLINTISFLNLGLAGFVLAAIAARFLFPAVSLEGRTLWLLRSSPLQLRSLLWSKFWVGIAPLLVLALALTIGTNLILRVSTFMMILSSATIIVMTFAISSMALGFGALFPRFDSENPAEIPTSFGGLLFMMTATAYLGIVIALQAWPVYSLLQAQQQGGVRAADVTWVAGSLGVAALVSVAAIAIPLRMATRRIETLDH